MPASADRSFSDACARVDDARKNGSREDHLNAVRWFRRYYGERAVKAARYAAMDGRWDTADRFFQRLCEGRLPTRKEMGLVPE